MKGLYQDILLDHYKHPRNAGFIDHADFSSGHYNPACGDKVNVCGLLNPSKNSIDTVQFQASGCVISVATASLLSEYIKGMPLVEVLALDASTILDLIGMQLGPTRLKCALLPLYALHDGLKKYQATLKK